MTSTKKESVKAIEKTEPVKKVALQADFGEVYISVEGNQILSPIKANLTLFEALGHIYSQGGKYLITATGYKYLNKVASISIVTPQFVVVDKHQMPNPHIERNPRTKAIESVNIRKMGIGLSPTGNVVILDKTLFYNVYTYFIQSVQAKMKRVKWDNTPGEKGKKTDKKEYPNCAVYGIEGQKPNIQGIKAWAFFPTEPPLGIWVNYEDQAIIDCLEEHTQRQRFGDRMAATIVERNILKDHPAIAASQVFAKDGRGGKEGTLTIYGYRNELEPKNIADILRQAESGGDNQFEIQAEEITQLDEEEEKAALKEVAGEDPGEPAQEDAGALFNDDESGAS